MASTHRWVSMLFQAAPHYAELYRAAIDYTDRASMACAAQPRPAIYLAHDRDMLAPHLTRLPPLKPADRVELTSSSPGGWTNAVKRALGALESVAAIHSGPLRADVAMSTEVTYADEFFDLPHGQMRVRRFGSPHAPPLLLLHDAPGSGVTLRALAQSMAGHWCVWLPDLPGCGASQPLPQAAPTIEDYAASLAPLIDRLAEPSLCLYGRGCGAAVALYLACNPAHRVGRVVLDELVIADLVTPPLDDRFCPPTTLEADGSHWFRTWQRLRDSQIFWPWYDTSARALLRLPGNFAGEFLHEWTLEVLQQPASAHCLPCAAMAVHAAALIGLVTRPLTLMARGGHPLAACAERARDHLPHLDVLAYREADRADELHRRLLQVAPADGSSERKQA